MKKLYNGWVMTDNKGKTCDRYSLFIKQKDNKWAFFSFSENPHHPQGVNQYGGEVEQAVVVEDVKRYGQFPKDKICNVEGLQYAIFRRISIPTV